MHQFRVWAPLASTLAVHIEQESYPMLRAADDWWTAEIDSAGAGTEYAFSIDGENPIPDPRSSFQPHGIYGPSRLIDHAAFVWTDQRWQAKPLASAIIYELHVGTFTPAGTFLSAIEQLDYLLELGITHLELMPVNEFSGDWGWGYDGVDLYAPHHSYGTPDDLKRLVNECHVRGLAVLLDVVYNHLGPAGNYLPHFGPYFTAAYKTPWGTAINFDHEGSYQTRRFLIDNALMWLRDYHFDGLRLDAVHAYYDRSALHFLQQLSTEVEALAAHLARHLVLIAESDLNDPRIVTSRDAGGFGIDAQWSDDFHHALHAVLTAENKGYYKDFGSLAQMAKALQRAYVYDGIFSSHRKRVHGRAPLGLSANRFLAYSQNHDQVGNRARGERLSQLVSLGRQKIAAALVLTAPFVPMLFQGEEWGASTPFLYFTQHQDQTLGKSVSEGRRREFQAFGWEPAEVPDPQVPATFHNSKLRWQELGEAPHSQLLAWYKTLIGLRKRCPDLTDGRLDRVAVRFDEQAKWLVIRRGRVEIACNLGPGRQAIPISQRADNLICSESGWCLPPGSIELPADSVAISSENY